MRGREKVGFGTLGSCERENREEIKERGGRDRNHRRENERRKRRREKTIY